MDLQPFTEGQKLRLFQSADPFKQWWSLDEMRFCAKCEHLFTGRDIKIAPTADSRLEFRCPTFRCDGSWKDWQYPELHL